MFVENCPIHIKFYRFTTLSTSASVYHSPAFFLIASFTFQDQLHCHCVNVMQNTTCHQTMLHLPTQAGSSLKISKIKPSFKEKKKREEKQKTQFYCSASDSPYLIQQTSKTNHIFCQKSLIFLLLSSRATFVHIAFNCKLRFSALWSRTPFVLPCNPSPPHGEGFYKGVIIL